MVIKNIFAVTAIISLCQIGLMPDQHVITLVVPYVIRQLFFIMIMIIILIIAVVIKSVITPCLYLKQILYLKHQCLNCLVRLILNECDILFT